MEYLILTYTNPGELVLDFTFGSGTTLVAAQNLGRKFIGIEKSPKYVAIAKERLSQQTVGVQMSEEPKTLNTDIVMKNCIRCEGEFETFAFLTSRTTCPEHVFRLKKTGKNRLHSMLRFGTYLRTMSIVWLKSDLTGQG
jgi:hypothetical protein